MDAGIDKRCLNTDKYTWNCNEVYLHTCQPNDGETLEFRNVKVSWCMESRYWC